MEIVRLRGALSSRLTIEDASALFLAERLEGILVTGDKRLRQHAEQRGIETHGLLWVIDMLVGEGAILPEAAAVHLERLVEEGVSRLPRQECANRIKRWRKR